MAATYLNIQELKQEDPEISGKLVDWNKQW